MDISLALTESLATPVEQVQMFCQSRAMRDVMTLIARAGATRAGVTIQGEAGTGRQMAARSIHASQGRGPFVTIDCARDADDLDALLFGVPPKATNGDAHDFERVSWAGVLLRASGGTVYFQNVPEAATRVQRRLARVFRDREVALADTGETIPLDVRPIVGVAPEIDSLVQEGRVREDLFRRVSAIRIEMPPLRNRREDIPALAEHFVREVCSARCAPLKTISGAALALVAALPWRGNAIELRTLIDNVVAGLGNERSIDLEDLLAHVRLDGAPAVWPAGGTLKEARARFEREYIAAVLEQHHGRISQAAKALGIQRTNLYRKLRVLRLEYQNKTH